MGKKQNKAPPVPPKEPGVPPPSIEELFFTVRNLTAQGVWKSLRDNPDLQAKARAVIKELLRRPDAQAFLEERRKHPSDAVIARELLKRLPQGSLRPAVPVIVVEPNEAKGEGGGEGKVELKLKSPFRQSLEGKDLPSLFALFGEPGRSDKERKVIVAEISSREGSFEAIVERLLDPTTRAAVQAFARFIIVAFQGVPRKFLLLWVDDNRELGRVFSEIFRDRSLRPIIRKSVRAFLQRSQGGQGPG